MYADLGGRLCSWLKGSGHRRLNMTGAALGLASGVSGDPVDS